MRDFKMPKVDPDKEDTTDYLDGMKKLIDITYQKLLEQQASYGIPYNYELPNFEDKKEECDHEWKTTQLVYSYVTYCEKCGEKQEKK